MDTTIEGHLYTPQMGRGASKTTKLSLTLGGEFVS